MNQRAISAVNERPADARGVAELPGPAVSAPLEHANPFRKLHRLLRGRYVWAILLGAIGAGAGGVLGYKARRPTYQSRGVIEVKPYIPRVLYETEMTRTMPMFDQFVASQVEFLQSPRVLDQAIAKLEEKQPRLSRGPSGTARELFLEGLKVERPARSTLVAVTFTDEDPEVADAAVAAVIDAYMAIFGERGIRDRQERLKVLEDKRTAYLNELTGLNKRILDLAEEYGSDSLRGIYQFKLGEMQEVEKALRATELALASAGVKSDPNDKEVTEDSDTDRSRWESMSVHEIATRDSHMRKLLEEKRELNKKIEIQRLRFVEKHPEIQGLLKLRSAVEQEIESHAAEFRRNGPTAVASGQPPIGLAPEGVAVETLRARQAELKQLHETARKETLSLGQRNVTISALKEDRNTVREQLEQVKRRIEQFNVEMVTGRIAVLSKGEGTHLPANQGTRKQLAVLGFMGGGSLGVGLVLFVGWRDRRLRCSEDAELSIGQVRMLGLLPRLPDDLSDPGNAANACYAVHHIRTLLELGLDGAGQQVFSVTSPVPKAGKTSLTLALGLSFASTGGKTLLIDCDLGGGGLTRRLQIIIRRRLGQILQRRGLVSEQQLQQALRLAQIESKRLGQKLVEMGVLDEDDLEEALSRQEKMPIGLLDALDGEPLENCIAETGIADLAILPVGDARATDISRVSPTGICRAINEARKRFDTILVDTGPLPDTVASGVAAKAADQTVLIVSRGDQRPATERAIAFLESIGARLGGMVFNRADARDIARSSFSSTSTLSQQPSQADSGNGDGYDRISRQTALLCADRFDPVTRAVASASGARKEADDAAG